MQDMKEDFFDLVLGNVMLKITTQFASGLLLRVQAQQVTVKTLSATKRSQNVTPKSKNYVDIVAPFPR